MKHNRFRTVAIAFALAAMSIASAQFVKTPNAPAHLKIAERFALGLRDQGKDGFLATRWGEPFNQYGASWANTVLSEPIFFFNLDLGKFFKSGYYMANTVCGNFVTRMLMQAYDWDWSNYTLANGNTTVSPDAAQYAYFINNNKGLSKISAVNNVGTGDLIVIDYSTTPNGNGDAGHVMIVRSNDGYITTTTDATHKKEYRIWKFGIADSTSDPHDSAYDNTDSRLFVTSNGTNHQWAGVGVGVFYVITDTSNKLLGYMWNYNTSKTSKTIETVYLNGKQTQSKRPIVFGKVN